MKQMSEKYHEVVNSDLALVNRLKNNDADAWTYFYNQYAPQIISFTIARGCNESQTQDVVQDTFITFHNGIHKFIYNKNKGRLKSYILRVAKTKMIDMYRKNVKYTFIEDSNFIETLIHQDQCTDTTSYNDMRFDIEVVKTAISKVKSRVKPKTFDCFYDAYMNENKISRVAQKQSVSPNLVSQHKHTVYSMVVNEGKQSIFGETLHQIA